MVINDSAGAVYHGIFVMLVYVPFFKCQTNALYLFYLWFLRLTYLKISHNSFFYVIYRRSAVNVNNIIFLIRRLWHLIILNYYQRGKNLYRHFLLSIVFSSIIFSIDAYVESHSDGSPVFRVSMMQQKCFRCYRIQFPIKLQSNRNCRRFFSSLVQLPSSDLLMAGVFFRHSFHFTIAYLSIKINFTAALCIDLYSGKWWKKRNSTTFYAFESSVFYCGFWRILPFGMRNIRLEHKMNHELWLIRLESNIHTQNALDFIIKWWCSEEVTI